MGISFEQPVMSGKQVAGNVPAPTDTATGAQSNPYLDYIRSLGTTNLQAPSDLPITTDPAYMIFAAHTGLEADLANIGLGPQIRDITGQANVDLARQGLTQQQETAKTTGELENRGVLGGSEAATKLAQLQGQGNINKADIIQKAQTGIDTATQGAQEKTITAGAGVAPQAVTAASNVATATKGA